MSGSIEIFHIYWKDDWSADRLRHHINSCVTLNTKYSPALPRVILIDDQTTHKSHKKYLSAIPTMAANYNLTIDFITFEKDLRKYLDAWLELQSNKDDLRRDLKSYNFIPQCSHYIAIWYYLRAGLIEDTENVFLPASLRAMDGKVEKPSGEVISILAKVYEPAEVEAENRIFAFGPKINIQRIYY